MYKRECSAEINRDMSKSTRHLICFQDLTNCSIDGLQLQDCTDKYGVAMSLTTPRDGATVNPVRLLVPVTSATVYIQASLLSTWKPQQDDAI